MDEFNQRSTLSNIAVGITVHTGFSNKVIVLVAYSLCQHVYPASIFWTLSPCYSNPQQQQQHY